MNQKKKKKNIAYPEYRSPDGEIYRCIFFATKTPPGLEWFGFEVHTKDRKDTLYFGLIDSSKKEFGYFSFNDLKQMDAQYTTDPAIINRIKFPRGWVRFHPEQAKEIAYEGSAKKSFKKQIPSTNRFIQFFTNSSEKK
ncbi:MAG: hypothetical protein GY754_28120 [bacterium]|nr:hypothetical protein [bacterium]